MTDQDDVPLQADSFVRQQVFWPQRLPEAGAVGLLRHWAALTHAPQLVLEASADASGVEYFVGSQLRHASAVRRAVEQLVGGAIVTSADPEDQQSITTARRLQLSSRTRPLEPSDAAASTRSILHALTAVDKGERLTLQVVLGPRRPPRLAPVEPKRSDQSTVSKVLHGVLPERTSDARQALNRKLGQHGFDAVVRIGVHATTAERRRVLLLGLAAAIGTVEAPGVYVKLRPEKPRRINAPRSSWSAFTPSSHLTVSEVAQLSAWPISDGDEPPLPGQPPRHPKPIRPTPAMQSGSRVIADANAPGAVSAIGYDVTDALRHSWIIGPNGVGKSTVLLNLIVQDLEAGRPVVVIEPKDLVEDILSRIPASRRDDVVLLDPLSSRPVGINGLDGRYRRGHTPEGLADNYFAAFRALHGDSLGPRSSDILRNCLEALTRRDDASLVMLPLLLTNPGFRRSLTQHAMRDDPFAAGPFWQWFDSLSPEAVATVTAPLSNKLRPLLSKQLRAALAQRDPKFNVRQVLRENKVLLVPLQKGIIGPENAELLAALVIAELWQAIRERAGTPQRSRQPVMVYIDECQDFMRTPVDISDALAQARSLGAAFHVSHQYEKQLPPAMLDAFRSNIRSRICFHLHAGDARDMAAGQTIIAPEDFSSLPAYHVYASLIRDNSLQPWASGITRPAPPKTSDPSDIRRRSEEQYGQPLDTIEAGFAELLDSAGTTDDAAEIGAPTRRRRQS
jgi:hypothetical protein